MRIPAPAKFLFDAILDDTFMYDFGGDGKGSMIASAKDLAIRYGHDDESIKRWAQILVNCGVIHVTKSWPDQEWYISAVRPSPISKANMRQRARARAAGLRDPDNSVTVGFANADGKNSLFLGKSGSPRIGNPTDPNPISAGAGSEIRQDRILNPKVSDLSGPQIRSLRKGNPTGSETFSEGVGNRPPKEPETFSEGVGFVGSKSPVDKGATTVLETSPDVGDVQNPLNVQRRANAFKKGGENNFLNHVGEVMSGYDSKFAKSELKNSGAWWRMKFRSDPDKACRVLAEIKRMITEGVAFQENPGAAAVDLWKRFS